VGDRTRRAKATEKPQGGQKQPLASGILGEMFPVDAPWRKRSTWRQWIIGWHSLNLLLDHEPGKGQADGHEW
jgi:hypothetical protein